MLDDKYRIERLLAVGGMGAVYEGTHIKLRKRVAIKVLDPQLTSPLMIERFHREAITASQIGHEGIAQVTDLGTSTDGEPFLVMEYLDGESLAGRLRASGPLPVEVACELGCAILSPLSAAHLAGIVHRDLKPDNVFLVKQSRGELVKLLDFGISRTTGLETEFRLTTTGLVLGTPYYMSPEQARGDSNITLAADLYAFGVILYEMLVGHVPIRGENYNQLMYRVMTGDFVRPHVERPDIPPALEQIILRTMALEAEHRPGSAQELEHALLAFCRPTFREHTIERISVARIASRATPFPSGASAGLSQSSGTDRTVLATPSHPTMTPPNRARPLLIAVMILAIAGIGFGAVVALRGGDAPASEPVAASPEVISKPVASPPAETGSAVAVQDPGSAAVVAPAAPASVTLRFAIEPAGAAITVDDVAVTGAELVVSRDDAVHKVKITAPGYAAHAEDVRFDESQRLSVQLKAIARSDRDRGQPTRTGRDKKIERIDTTSPYH
jgi:serine/threonine protein kinase